MTSPGRVEDWFFRKLKHKIPPIHRFSCDRYAKTFFPTKTVGA